MKKLADLYPWAKRKLAAPYTKPLSALPVRSSVGPLQYPHWEANDCPGQADCGERFRTAPVGTWREAHDSEFVGDIWEFKSDHTGKVEGTNFLGTISSEVLFEWKEIADFTIAIKLTLWDGEVLELEEGEDEWDVVKYGLTSQVIRDQGPKVVLCELNRSGEMLHSFWIFKGPLVLLGDW